jgi:PAS domain-containing protein
MSVINTREPVVLEPASQALVEATVGPPFLHELSPVDGTRFDGEFKRVNASFLRLLGYTRPELFSRTVLDLVHPDDVSAPRRPRTPADRRARSGRAHAALRGGRAARGAAIA